MKIIFALFLIIFSTASNAQSFVNYKDTINHFSIDIPVGWRYGASKNYPSIKLLAYRIPISNTDTSKDTYNLNIIETPNLDLNKTYLRFLNSLKSTQNFKLIDFGDTIINSKKFKWLIQTHTNENDKIQMHNYDFVTYQNGKTYILTLITFSNRFEFIKPIFIKIATSLILAE